MIVISNQACVGKGLLDPAVLQGITVQMHQNLAAIGVFMSAAYYCIHRPDDNCICRKPKPGLLQNAAEDYNIDLSRSIFIGDSDTDIQAGLAGGCKPVLFGSTHLESSGYSPPASCIPVARAAEELFPIAVRCLTDCGASEPTGDSV
jgi:histidinol-phosphate phosphatase family protein